MVQSCNCFHSLTLFSIVVTAGRHCKISESPPGFSVLVQKILTNKQDHKNGNSWFKNTLPDMLAAALKIKGFAILNTQLPYFYI